MTSPVIKIVRWGALLGGVGYGFVHHYSLARAEKAHREQQEAQRKQTLLDKYYAWKDEKEWASYGEMELNPDKPGFDLEKIVAFFEKRNESKA